MEILAVNAIFRAIFFAITACKVFLNPSKKIFCALWKISAQIPGS